MLKSADVDDGRAKHTAGDATGAPALCRSVSLHIIQLGRPGSLLISVPKLADE